jgi:hypothetical protein
MKEGADNWQLEKYGELGRGEKYIL